MKKSIISIVVPIYKVPEIFLRKCIESLQQQTLENIEILLIDDGSPDDCGKICDEYALNDNRIRVIHQKNKGLCGARNSGIKNATSEWIAFVDGDDWLEKDFCEIMLKNSDDVDIVFSGYVKDYGKKIVTNDFSNYFENNKIYKTPDELIYMKKMILNFSSYSSSCCAKLIKKDILINNNIFFDENLKQGAEGIEFCFRLYSYVSKIKVLCYYAYHYTYNDQSISTVSTIENNYMTIKCFEKIKETIDDGDFNLLEWYYNRLLYVIVTTAISGYFHPARKISYKKRKQEFIKYINNINFKEILKNANIKKLDKQRRIIIFLINYKIYSLIYIFAILRNLQKNAK